MFKVIGEQLTPEMTSLINDKKIVAVLATVSEDGSPNTAPMHLLKAMGSKKIHMAIGNMHQSYMNIKENGRVMLSVLECNDMAFSIKGKASVIKDSMAGNKLMAMVEIDVLEIKSDTTPTLIVTEGIKTTIRSQKTTEFFKIMFDELSNYGKGGVL